MKLSVETKVGIFTTAGLIALAWIIIYYGGYKFGEDKGYTFTVLFQRVDGLKRGADIQVAGVRVGQIMNVNFDKDQTVRVIVKVESLSVDID
ncbi:MAG: MlaD family protein, partial [Candidatus Eremiobacterota bacterium]